MSIISNLFRDANDPFGVLSSQGQMFRASAAAVDTAVTGSTSFANTDPTFLLNVPPGLTCIPAEMRLFQSGTVAGGAVSILMEVDDAARYTSGGTAMTILGTNMRATLPRVSFGTLAMYSATGSAIIATAAYGVRVDGYLLGQDVSPAEGAVNQVLWTPSAGVEFLQGPASWLIYTYAASTGPTWLFSFKFAAFPSEWMLG